MPAEGKAESEDLAFGQGRVNTLPSVISQTSCREEETHQSISI